jgi:hypothetical protein
VYAPYLTVSRICTCSGSLHPAYVHALAHFFLYTPSKDKVSKLPKLSSSRSQTYKNFYASMRTCNHSLTHNRSSTYAQERCLYKRPLPLIYTLQVASLEASTRPLCPHIHFIHITICPHRYLYSILSTYPLCSHGHLST